MTKLRKWCQKKSYIDPFYCAFLEAQDVGARIGSISPWLPNTGMSKLNFLSNTTESYKRMDHQIFNPMPAYPNRGDRKMAWELSYCQDNASSTDISTLDNIDDDRVLQFTLMEPDLKWLAFHGDNAYATGAFRVRINGHPMEFNATHPGIYYRMGRLRAIFHIPDLVPPAPYYTFSFCKHDVPVKKAEDEAYQLFDEKQVWLNYMVAVVQKTMAKDKKQQIVPFY